MNRAASHLLEVTDFTSFSKLHTDAKTNICHVSRARWEEVDDDLWRFEITADRFLRNMVRAASASALRRTGSRRRSPARSFSAKSEACRIEPRNCLSNPGRCTFLRSPVFT